MRARLAAGGLVLGLSATVLAGCGTSQVATYPTCTSGAVTLDLDQAANAATIAAVGKRIGMP
ncbi:MAG: hypothetical protein JWM40_1736, partial [Frankiales bacterium]|nr:hypothetical protein [Frankiales bacterium]